MDFEFIKIFFLYVHSNYHDFVVDKSIVGETSQFFLDFLKFCSVEFGMLKVFINGGKNFNQSSCFSYRSGWIDLR